MILNGATDNPIKEIEEHLQREEQILITFVNPFSYYNLRDNNNSLIKKIDFLYSDGVLLTKLNNLFSSEKIQRYSFDYSSIAGDFFELAIEKDFRVAIVGAKIEEISLSVQRIQKKHPKLNIAYFRDGYLENDISDLVHKLKSENIDFLLVGTGSPRQEKLIVEIAEQVNSIKLMVTCGGFLTQTALKSDYYWYFAKKFNLRWLQRAILHSHVRKRLILDYPKFLVKFILEKLF